MSNAIYPGWYAMEPDGTTRPLRDGERPSWEMGHRRVAETTVGELWVSTVFLGLDHGFLERGRPVLFETMVFEGSGAGGADLLCWRYYTKAEAEAGHAAIVAALQAGVPIDDIEQPS